MKAVIPAAGLGTRLRPLTYTRPKPVLRVAGKPIIRHAIDNLVAAGIHDIGIVVSDLTRQDIMQAIDGLSGVNVEYIDQRETLGLGHAVKMARDWIAGDDFCVYLGDNLFQKGVLDYIEMFQAQRPDALIALVEVADPSSFGVAEMNGDRIMRLVEKPKVPPSNLAVAGVYCFQNRIFDILETLQPSARGEYEITDAIQQLIEQGGVVMGRRVEGWWKDTGRPYDLIDANRLLLEELEPRNDGEVHDSRITGRVAIGSGSTVTNSVIVGPALIGRNVTLENAYVGPFTSIGSGSTIRDSEVEHSVIEEEVVIDHVDTRLQDCLIGLRASVRGGKRVPRTLSFTLSDASSVELA
ncbi:glucose-1-phosphate thymidylyltransferase [Deinococcus peraridilitoris]|uniref:Glucose-1-phosphate thymidylylransferase, long form n=1 Tax=Deinococcus peraridilitoris (strain DSM 19664 / LMG 22246 / CIP 109416 / KR-200) TaxID=937777 RepID=K9ZXX3_DEIPD|nr:glucose-1-phosphate thymidylyltransferase [Deinococcus peraridilitoris]AFZ66513.1 glucose-1-phosphate thymidylylransferase, long form [Deinococcus peraridilitoris DSM 19664]